jgi:putative aminopeptidase FrvX
MVAIMRPLQSGVIVAVWLGMITSVTDARTPTLAQEIEGLLRVASITGHEAPAVQYLRQRLHGLPVAEDALGNLTVTLGSGGPRRLVACIMDEPGYVVSRIQEDGYLRLSRVGSGPRSTLWDQSHEGQQVMVITEQGLMPGAIGVTSIHLAPEHPNIDGLFSVDQAYVDVGAETAAEVDALGIRLLDPVALTRRVVQFPGGLLAAPSARTKAGCMAIARVTRRIARAPAQGTVVFAWTVLGHMGRRGLERVVQHHGPFEEVFLLSDGFGWHYADGQWARTSLPAPGSGLLAAGALAVMLPQTMVTPHVEPSASLFTGDPNWGSARVGYLGLPAGYPDTPIELIDLGDVARLIDGLVIAAGGKPAEPDYAPPLPAPPPLFEDQTGHEETAQVLGALISRYGVSGAEEPVRDQIRALLPVWTQPRTDTAGNLLVTFGHGAEHVVFVAHMDEVGFQVVAIREDGRLLVRPRGGLYASLWEAQAGLVHTARGAVPAVFEPRPNWHTATHRAPPRALTVFVGVTSRQEAEALGIQTSQTVTMPKRLLRLGRHRVLARSLDDRVGCTALLLALRRLEAQALRRRLTFAWVVEEEIGLGGSRALAATLPDVTRVYPVDTFVSSDAPLESRRFAFAPLGQGAVIRAMDSGNIVPRRVIDELRALAQSNGIPLQYGMTGGWSDGTPFLANGLVNVPLSWPGRYSHSPVEVADLRDIEALVRLIAAIAMQ